MQEPKDARRSKERIRGVVQNHKSYAVQPQKLKSVQLVFDMDAVIGLRHERLDSPNAGSIYKLYTESVSRSQSSGCS